MKFNLGYQSGLLLFFFLQGIIFCILILKKGIETENRSAYWLSAFKQEFTINDQGELQVTADYTTHAPYTLTQVLADLSGIESNNYTGVFHNAETGAEISIEHLSDFYFRVSISNQNSYNATLLKPGLMIAGSYQISFPVHQTGNIERFLLDGERIKDVEFVRVGNDR